MKQKKPSGPPSVDEINATLAEAQDGRSLKPSVIMAVADHLSGGHVDWEGRWGLDVREALGHKVGPYDDHTTISAAVRLSESVLRGCGWQWLLRSVSEAEGHEIQGDPKCTLTGLVPPGGGYLANHTLKLPGGDITCMIVHKLAGFAFIISLNEAVVRERKRQFIAKTMAGPHGDMVRAMWDKDTRGNGKVKN